MVLSRHHVVVAPGMTSSTAAPDAKAMHRSSPLILWVQNHARGVRETGQAGSAAHALAVIQCRLLLRADCVVVIHDCFAGIVAHDFHIDPERVEEDTEIDMFADMLYETTMLSERTPA